MGQVIKDTRRLHPPLHCVWCGKIMVGTAWVAERRESHEGRYADGICPECRADYFLDALTRPGKRAS